MKANPIKIQPLAPRLTEDGTWKSEAQISGIPDGPEYLWFEWSKTDAPKRWPTHGHAYLLGALFSAMRHNLDIRIEAPVCLHLLENLQWFMDVWHAWFPETYSPIEIFAKPYTVETDSDRDRQATLLFSGGLDSCYALFLHTLSTGHGLRKRNIREALLIHGADFTLEDLPMASAAAKAARTITDDVAVPLRQMRTNIREFADNWEHCHGSALVACLSWYSALSDTGIMASSASVAAANYPWGSQPVTDPCLSSQDFRITTDTLTQTRAAKTASLKDWPVALDNMRTCYSQNPGDFNCGYCRKCIFTRIGLLACGIESKAFPKGMRLTEVIGLWAMPDWSHFELLPMIEMAKRNGLADNMPFKVLSAVVFFNRHIYMRGEPFFRKLTKPLRRLRRRKERLAKRKEQNACPSASG